MNHDDDSGIPFSQAAEHAVIGAIINRGQAIDDVGALKPEHFYVGAHREIFRAMLDMSFAGKDIDVITLAEYLDASGKTDVTGGLPYLGQIASNTVSTSVHRYAQIVIDKSMERSMLAAAADIHRIIGGAEPTAEKLNQVQALVMAIAESTTAKQPRKIGDALIDYVARLEERNSGDEPPGLMTGLVDLDAKLNGLQDGNLIIVAGRPSMGKAQPLNAQVLMSNGEWKRMGDVSVGDSLASVDGRASFVSGVFPQGKKMVFRVSFSDGRVTHCCAEHLWSVMNRKWKEPRVMRTSEIIDLLKNPSMKNRIYINQINGEFGMDKNLPIDPWVLGALLGDGCVSNSSIRFTKGSNEIVEILRSRIPDGLSVTGKDGVNWRVRVDEWRGKNQLKDGLAELGLIGLLSHQKFIPDLYISGSRSTRRDVLRGLLDTDGWVEKHGSVLYSSASKELSIGVQKLARSLGYYASLREKKTTFRVRGEIKKGMNAYVVTISGKGKDELFLFSGKRDRCYLNSRIPRLNILSIEPVGVDECQCISVTHESRLYVTDDYIVTHNTAFTNSIAVNVARGGHAVGIMSMEMTEVEQIDRVVATVGRVALDDVLKGNLAGDSGDRICAAIAQLQDMPLFIDEESGLSAHQVMSKARQLKRKHNLKLLIVDALGLMQYDANKAVSELGAITKALKGLAKQLGIPIILLCQLSRKCEDRNDKRPIMSDLRDSGNIEQDTDVIIMLYRDEYYNPDTPDKGIAEALIRKARMGKTGVVPLAFIGEQTRFDNLAHDWRPMDQDDGFRKGKRP